MKEWTAGLHKCMEEGDGRAARNELAVKHGWKPISRSSSVLTESWEQEKDKHGTTGVRIDYFPMTDRILMSDVKTGKSMEVFDSIGGNIGLEILIYHHHCERDL